MQDQSRFTFECGDARAADVFAEHGVVCFRDLVRPSEIDLLRDWIEVAIQNPSPRFVGTDNATFLRDGRLWARFDGFRDFAFSSRIAEAAALIMASDHVRMYNDSMFVKEPSAPEPTPWHQDLPYFNIEGTANCSAWIPLDPANEASGAMSYVIGSHRFGKMFRPVNLSKPSEFRTEDEFDGGLPDIDGNPELYPTVTFDLRPGDVVFHHLLTLHKSGPNNNADRRRRVHTMRLAGDGMKWKKRAYSSVEFHNDLQSGDLLQGPEFPVLWPRSA